ncbi:protein of unknown function [Cardinium endosymbiont cEper1 of Encarsia pergandiella]|nr:protein of unknown function [Cardinium endosymbiont cEper1 of Encarsia pergandiella]
MIIRKNIIGIIFKNQWGRGPYSFYQKKQKTKKNDTAKEFLATISLSHAIKKPPRSE